MTDRTLPNPLRELTIEQLRARTSMKWHTYGDDVLPLWVAEMDVRLAPPVHAELQRAIDTGDTGYPAGNAYAEAFKSFAAQRWGWDGVEVDRTTIVPDVMMGIVEVLRLITNPHDAVIVTAPVYAPFYAFVTHADREIIEARLSPAGRLDLASLEAAFQRARARSEHPVLLLSNPHNPTGTAHSREELEQVAALARQYGVRVISDEIHAPLVLDVASFTPFLSVTGSENAFALVSASKAWNLAGLKAALVLAGEDAVDDLARMPEEVSHGPSHLGVLAHTASFRDGAPWLDSLLAGLAENRALLAELVAAHLPGVSMRHPEATYLAWLDCTSLGLEEAIPKEGLAVVSDQSGPAQFFLENAKVALSSGHVFGDGGTGHVRLNYATHPDILTEAITRMGTALTTR
ncbi:MAG: MalY/PatB family protein [Leucobacter sp.]